ALVLAACASKPTSNLGIKGAPDWVNQGTQALKDDGSRYIYGIGSAPTMNDLSLQTSTADERARSEVARVLSSYMHVVSQDYGAAAGISQEQMNEQSVSRQIESIINQNVSGSQVTAHWLDPKTGSLWSLVKLDMNNVKTMVASSDAMNVGFKNFFAAHADNVFDGMAKGGSHE
ncbi:MAG: LPP20 family lipoprotein, partial [Gammaproteobacteria bacterium]